MCSRCCSGGPVASRGESGILGMSARAEMGASGIWGPQGSAVVRSCHVAIGRTLRVWEGSLLPLSPGLPVCLSDHKLAACSPSCIKGTHGWTGTSHSHTSSIHPWYVCPDARGSRLGERIRSVAGTQASVMPTLGKQVQVLRPESQSSIHKD